MAHTVVGIFDNSTEAQRALQQLISFGISQDRIDISTPGTSGTTSGTTSTYNNTSSTYNDNDDDGVSRFFRNLFGSDDDDNVRTYSEVGRRGSIITVHASTPDEAESAARILDQYGAVDVDERAQQYRSNQSYTNTNTADTTTGAIPIIEEELQVGKRVVETGGARIRSRIIERPVEESVRLRVEHVRVERNPVNRPATEADLANFREGEIEIREQAEVPVVGKEARVVEEVRLGKEVEEREETIHDTVRRTDVEVENLDTDINNTTTNRTTNLNDVDRNPNL